MNINPKSTQLLKRDLVFHVRQSGDLLAMSLYTTYSPPLDGLKVQHSHQVYKNSIGKETNRKSNGISFNAIKHFGKKVIVRDFCMFFLMQFT